MKKTMVPKTTLLALAIAIACIFVVREPEREQSELRQLSSPFKFSHQSITKSRPDDKNIFSPEFTPFSRFIGAFLPVATTFFAIGTHQFLCVADSLNSTLAIHSFKNNKHAKIQDINLSPFQDNMKSARPSACLQGDWNRDGLNDLIVGFWGSSPLLLITQPETTADSYIYKVTSLLEEPETWYTQSIASGDIDGDGALDLVIANYFSDEARVLRDGPGSVAAMNNGWSRSNNGGRNRLFLGARGKTAGFHEAVDTFSEHPSNWTIAIGVADLDGDLLPEIIFLNDHGTNLFLHNRSTPGNPLLTPIVNDMAFNTPKSKTLGRDDFHGMGIDFGDMNNDGFLDWGVSNFGADFAFHQSHFTWIHTGDNSQIINGRAPFKDESESLGLARTHEIPWDLRYADFDNDGILEVFQSIGFVRGDKNWTPLAHELALQNDLIVTYPRVWHALPDTHGWAGNGPNSFFVRDKAGRYADIGRMLGFQEPGVSRGIATTDINFDGLIDYYIGNQRNSDSFYLNQSASKAKFIALKIDVAYDANKPDAIETLAVNSQIATPTRDGIGASVTLARPDGTSTIAQVDGGSGFGGKKHRFVHFGLGQDDIKSKYQIRIEWRDDRGKMHSQSLEVSPGWHRIVLGKSDGLAQTSSAGGKQ